MTRAICISTARFRLANQTVIDKHPRFYFVAEGETVEGAIAFDMYGAEFTNHGEDCTSKRY